MLSNHLILRHPSPFSFNLSQYQGLFNESALRIRWPKYWSFNFRISPSNEYSGLISLKIDWFDLLTVQGTLKSPLQHHSSKASILRCSAFFVVQLSHPYMTTGKNHSQLGVLSPKHTVAETALCWSPSRPCPPGHITFPPLQLGVMFGLSSNQRNVGESEVYLSHLRLLC